MKILAERISDRKVFLYGAGNIGKHLCEFLESQGIKVACFLDKKENSSSIGGLRVVNPFAETIEKTDSIVIVSIFNRDVDYLSIKEQLLDTGFNEVISFIEFYPYISKTFGGWYWLSSNKDYLQDEEALCSVNDLWSDDLSREIFLAIIAARKLDKYELLPQKYPIEDQYLSSDIPLKNYSKFIDCGAFDGDTLDAMENKGIRYEKIYAFEPDLQNFNKLAAKVKKYHQQAILFPCGVASSTQLLRFDSGVGEGSAILESGNSVVQCIALDDVLININGGGGGTLLKMDIEGAELDALMGAENFIRKNEVDLAICLYHKPQDIIKIPLLIHTFGSYDFYLRLYGYYGMELVLYAINSKCGSAVDCKNEL